MAIDPANAAAAYRAASSGRPTGMEPGGAPGMESAAGADDAGSSFVELVRTAAQEAIDTNREAERTAMEGVAGKADLTEVVTAVSEAEATLQSVVAVRDRIISAYQKIMRMPI